MTDINDSFIDPENEPVAPAVVPEVQVVFLKDRSGSMRGKEEQVVGGFNDYIKTLKADDKTKYFVTRCQFDDEFQTDFAGVPLDDVQPMTAADFVPRGWTHLHDGIAYAVRAVEKVRKPGQGVLMVIHTDGQNNRREMQEFNSTSINSMLEERKQNDWTFVYVDADPTTSKAQAAMTAQSIGIAAGNAFKMAPGASYQDLYGGLAHATVNYSACRSATFKSGGELSAMNNFCDTMQDTTAPKPPAVSKKSDDTK